MTHAVKCPVKGCDTRLRWTVDAIGRAVAQCDGCARRDRGLCLDCPAKLPEGKRGARPLRCGPCDVRHSRHYQRDYSRRARRANAPYLAVGTRCTAKAGRYVCGGVAEVPGPCRWCRRRQDGICRDCDAPVVGRVGGALRCALHRKLAQEQYTARYQQANRTVVRRRSLVRERSRVGALSPAGWAQHIERKRLEKFARRRATPPSDAPSPLTARPHRCIGPALAKTPCDTMLRGNVRKCPACHLADRREARRRLAAMGAPTYAAREAPALAVAA